MFFGSGRSPDYGGTSPVRRAFRATRSEWLHIGVFSAAVNILMLTGSIYMLQIYDRVLSGRSLETLLWLSLIVLVAFMLQGALDGVRLRMLGRVGASFDEALSSQVARATVILPLRGASPSESMQPVRDLDTVRSFLSSLGPTALLDMPFVPIFLAGCFILHPWVGWFSVGGALIVVALTLLTERVSKEPSKAMASSAAHRQVLAEAGRRNAEAVAALGMTSAYVDRFNAAHSKHIHDHLNLNETTARISTAAKIARSVLQSAILGLGAWLVIRGEMSGGAMIAASIMMSRALAPIELAVANWRGFVAARQGGQRLNIALAHVDDRTKAVDLPMPRRDLVVSELAVAVPNTQRVLIQNLSLSLKAGQVLGLVGPSGSGKSTLARAMTGIWPPAHGTIRLDGAKIEQWSREALGRSIGYLPQDVELFDGTVADNIARFDPARTSEGVMEAAHAAGADQMIRELPAGYDTVIGDRGAVLSGGQRQRLALARALYGKPFLVVLDEPNASLDTDGDDALTGAILGVKARGGIVVVITHRQSGVAAADMLGAMEQGRLWAIGPRDEVMQKIAQAHKAKRAASTPLKQVWPAAYRSPLHGTGQPPKTTEGAP
ncbi:MAG: type I secretion system permease/ATPase [Bosea sp. (in: a-proteobacteria)]